MDKRFEDIEYYIYIQDDNVVSENLNDRIQYQKGMLSFLDVNDMTIQVIHEITKAEVIMSYQIASNIYAEIVETRFTKGKASITRNMHVGRDSALAMLVFNDSEQDLTVLENVQVEENAHVECAYGELTFTNVDAKYEYHLLAQEANVTIRNAVLSANDNAKKIEVSLIHECPHTYGEMLNYGVAKDHSKLFFDGVGRIMPLSYGSATHQTSKIMVFDEGCQAKANPYLYIDEYDVAASHAAAVGKMDEEHLFYLQSRGLNKNQSMKLITYGYLMPAVDVIHNQKVKDTFSEILEKRMGD